MPGVLVVGSKRREDNKDWHKNDGYKQFMQIGNSVKFSLLLVALINSRFQYSLFISIDLDTCEHLVIGSCLHGFVSTRRKVRCRGHSYTLASTPYSTDQCSCFNPVMLKTCGDVESNPGPIN